MLILGCCSKDQLFSCIFSFIKKKNNDLQLLHMHVTFFFIKIQQNIDNLCIKYLLIVHYKWCLIHFLSNQHVVIDCYSCVYNKTCPPFTSPSPWPSFRSDAHCTFHCGTCKWNGKIPLASSPLVWFWEGISLDWLKPCQNQTVTTLNKHPNFVVLELFLVGHTYMFSIIIWNLKLIIKTPKFSNFIFNMWKFKQLCIYNGLGKCNLIQCFLNRIYCSPFIVVEVNYRNQI